MGIIDPYSDQQQTTTSGLSDPYAQPKRSTGRVVLNNATDLVDMVLGFPAFLAQIGTTGVADLAFSAQYALGRTEELPSEKANRVIGQAMQAPWMRFLSAPLRTTETWLGVGDKTEEDEQANRSVLAKAGGVIEEAKTAAGEYYADKLDLPSLKSTVPQITDVAMADLPFAASKVTSPMMAKAKEAYNKARARYSSTKKIQEVSKTGVTADQTADAILDNASKRGIDTSSITKEDLVKEIKKTTGENNIERRSTTTPAPVERRGGEWNEMKKAEYKSAADVIRQYNKVLSASDPATTLHENRVASATAMVAKELGLPEEQIVRADIAALGHDLKKLGMRDIVSKQSSLTPDDVAKLANHPKLAADMLRKAGLPEPIAKIVEEHHTLATTEFTSQLVRTMDIADSLIGGANSGHNYPMRWHNGLKTETLPRTAANILKVLDGMQLKGEINPEIYTTYRKMFVEGRIPHAQKIQLEAAGETPWNKPALNVMTHTDPTELSGWVKGTSYPEMVLNSLPEGMAKAAKQMVDRATRNERGGLVISDSVGILQDMTERFSRISGLPLEDARKVVTNAIGDPKKVGGYYEQHIGTLYYNVDGFRNPRQAAEVIMHEVSHAANNNSLNMEIYNRVMNPDKLFDPNTQAADIAFYSRIRDKLISTKSTDKPTEATAYLISEAMDNAQRAGFSRLDRGFWEWAQTKLPQSVVTFLKQIVANVRATLYKYNVALSESDLTVDDILAYNHSNMKDIASGKMDAYHGEYTEVTPKTHAAVPTIYEKTPEAPKELPTLDDFKPENITGILNKNDWAILTAENPQLHTTSPKTAERLTAHNTKLMAQLRKDLDSQGIKYIESQGQYGGMKENSLVLIGVPLKKALEIGKKYGQESVLTKEGLTYTKNGLTHPATDITKLDHLPDDNFTYIPSTGAIFHVNFDFFKTPIKQPGFANIIGVKGDLPDELLSPAERYFRALDRSSAQAAQQGQYFPRKNMTTDALMTILEVNRRVSPKETVDSPNGIESIKRSLEQHGFIQPITVTVSSADSMAYVADGNTRVLAAKELGIKEIPVRFDIKRSPLNSTERYHARPLSELGISRDMIGQKFELDRRILTNEEIRSKKIESGVGQEGSVSVLGTHFSKEARDVLSGKFYGTGAKGEEIKRLATATDPRIKNRLSFYVDEGKGVKPEAGVGAFKHTVELSNLYDLAKNPLRFSGKDLNKLESDILDAGYSGYYVRDWRMGQGAAVLLGDAAKEVRPMDKSAVAFEKQTGRIDQSLLIKSGFILGGAAFGAYLMPADATEGLIAGAAVGFGITALPRATRAIADNWKGALKIAATGAAYAGVGALADHDNPVEGILVGSTLFGMKFLPKSRVHPEDELINARNGNIAAEKRLIAQVSEAMKKAIPDLKQREELSVMMENPTFTGRTPAEKQVVAAWRGLSKSYYDLAKNENVKIGFIEGYVSHIIDREGIPQSEFQKIIGDIFGINKAAVSGKAKFTKERMYPTFADLEKALDGTPLKIRTKDIAEIAKVYSETMTRTIENQKLLNQLKEATLNDPDGTNARLVTTELQPGYVRLPNPQLLPYYVHPDIAPALKFVFDSRNHTDLANGLITLNRATKRINVLGSFFHAKSLLEAYALAGGPLFKAKGAIDASLKQFKNGGLGDELDHGIRSGLRIEMPTEISDQALAQVGQLMDYYTGKLLGKEVKFGTKVGSAFEAFQEKIFDKFTWEYLHTGLKTATYLRLMEDYKLGTKGKGMPIDQYRQGAASFVNDTFGGLDWYRIASESKTEAGRRLAMAALKPSSRDILGIGIFAPDWTISTVRAMTKALPGGAKNPVNHTLAKGYALRTAILYATVINGINFALTGHFAWDNKDPTRIELGDGTNMQVVKHSMEFAEWVREPFKTFSNKMGFLPRMGIALVTGEEYPHGPKIEESKLSFAFRQIAPFSARSFQGELTPQAGAARSLLGTFGISVYGMTEKEKEYAREQRRKHREERAQYGIKDPYQKD